MNFNLTAKTRKRLNGFGKALGMGRVTLNTTASSAILKDVDSRDPGLT